MGIEHMHFVIYAILPQSIPLFIMNAPMRLNTNTRAIVITTSAVEISNAITHSLNVPLLFSHTTYDPINKLGFTFHVYTLSLIHDMTFGSYPIVA